MAELALVVLNLFGGIGRCALAETRFCLLILAFFALLAECCAVIKGPKPRFEDSSGCHFDRAPRNNEE